MSVAPYFAPELGLVCDRCRYKHSAPLELKPFTWRLCPRCVSAVNDGRKTLTAEAQTTQRELQIDRPLPNLSMPV